MRNRTVLLASSVSLLCILIVLAFQRWDLNNYRTRVEQLLHHALGVECKIDGDLKLSLLPRPILHAETLKLRDGKKSVANIGKISVAFDLLPLLQAQFLIHKLSIEQSEIILSTKSWPLTRSKKQASASPSSIWNSSSESSYEIIHGRLIFNHSDSPWHISIDDLNLAISTAEPAQSRAGVTPALTGELQAHHLDTKLMGFDKVRMQVHYDNGMLSLTDISTRLFQGEGYGDFSVDWRNRVPLYQLNFRLQEMEAAVSLSRLARQGLIEGPLSLYADLHWQGTDSKSMLANLNGVFNLYGERLLLKRIDLDKTISNFNQSQRFNLVDLGAYFFIGPMGTLATKGYSFAKLGGSSTTDSSQIMYLISDWELKNGIASAADVALSTQNNRLALQGKLDIPNGRYDGIVFALINKQGCASISQRISGAFETPKIEQAKMLSALTAPVLDVLDVPKKIFTSKACTPFYTGRLQHPIRR